MNKIEVSDLLELRKKATQGILKWDDVPYLRVRADCEYIAALKNFFDLPSTQAMLEKGERKDDNTCARCGHAICSEFTGCEVCECPEPLRATAPSNHRDAEDAKKWREHAKIMRESTRENALTMRMNLQRDGQWWGIEYILDNDKMEGSMLGKHVVGLAAEAKYEELTRAAREEAKEK